MHGKAEQEYRGKDSSDSVAGDIDQAMQSKKYRGDECAEPVALIRSFLKRKYFPNQKTKADNDENNGQPTELRPKPEPITFRMKRSFVVKRCRPKRSEHWFEI